MYHQQRAEATTNHKKGKIKGFSDIFLIDLKLKHYVIFSKKVC